MAIQIAEIKLNPDPLVPGKKVKGTCKVTSAAGIESVKLYDPRDWLLTMYDDGTHGDEVAGDNVYTLEEQVPYDADAGTYYATIVVTDKKGNVERKTIELRLSSVKKPTLVNPLSPRRRGGRGAEALHA